MGNSAVLEEPTVTVNHGAHTLQVPADPGMTVMKVRMNLTATVLKRNPRAQALLGGLPVADSSPVVGGQVLEFQKPIEDLG